MILFCLSYYDGIPSLLDGKLITVCVQYLLKCCRILLCTSFVIDLFVPSARLYRYLATFKQDIDPV